MRRVLLRLVPEAGDVEGLSLLDLRTLAVQTFLFEEIDAVFGRLESYDVVGPQLQACDCADVQAALLV